MNGIFTMAMFALKRLLAACFVIVGVVTAVFFIQRAVPGDPAENILGEQASEVDKEAFRERLGLNLPASDQYINLWKSIGDGSLGISYESGERPRTVSSILFENLPATVELALAGILVAMLIAFPLGVGAALRPYSALDQGSGILALMGAAIPNFWLGPLVIFLFCVNLKWLPDPGFGMHGVATLILPAFVLGTALSAKLMRMIRSSVLETLRAPHVVAARSRGLSEMTLMRRHVLRNAMVPILTLLSLQFASLLTGAIVTEKVFGRPGLGTLLLDAVSTRNYPVVQGTVVLMAALYTLVNSVTDIAYGWIDPRIRVGRTK